MSHQARPMLFVVLDSGCFVALTHRLNQDGYLRKAWGSRHKGLKVLEMFHRFIYRAHKGPIPEGHEVDHMCKNRACCNPAHLQAIDATEHTILTNRTRVLRRNWAECH